MRLLLDSHVVIAFSLKQIAHSYPRFAKLLADPSSTSHVSTASLWEIAIKVKLGKLRLGGDIGTLPDLLRDAGVEIFPVSERHATADRALAGRPLAWREI